MKYKLLLGLLFFSFLGNNVSAQNIKKIKKQSSISRASSSSKVNGLIPPPLATAGSACKRESDATVKVFITASGNSGDVIEWFDSQTSTTILRSGSIFSPDISKTTTYYVQSHSGSDVSVRVPVVASVYIAPPTVTLNVTPDNNPICQGVPLTFTAVGGADLFEFSVNGFVVQPMSTNRVYTTSSLMPGEIVSVKTRFDVNYDGMLTETAWGSGNMEDNVLAAALSPNASNGYINSIKISPTEDKLVFGISGKLENNRSALLFLDTKPGGFNVANYGDEANVIPSVKGFNFFNNNPSTFDSYFLPDYCLTISTDDGGTNYFADIIELKSGVSTKINLGNASNGTPSSFLGVNTNNTGSTDYDLGFEVGVLKSLIGYTTGDIKFFGFTMQDDDELNYNVTNSFLSPERTSSIDFGSGAINYNLRDPKAVVVSADALMPCYEMTSVTVNIVKEPTVATAGPDQLNCSLISTSLGGNSPEVGTGVWSLKSGPGVVTFTDVNNGDAIATVDREGDYVFTWTITNSVCDPSTDDINVRFSIAPLLPQSNNITECEMSPLQTLTANATVENGSTVKWYDALTGGNVVTSPTLNAIGTITYYAEAVKDISLCTSTSRTPVTLTINPIPMTPVSGGDMTECEMSPIQTLTANATVATGESVKWYDASTGGNLIASPTLNAIGTVTYYAEAVNDVTSCVSSSRTSVVLTINPLSVEPVSTGNIVECEMSPIQTLTANATVNSGESIKWYDALTGGNVVTSPILNAIGTVTYYAEAVKDISLCTSLSRTPVVLTINPIPVVPVSGGDITECEMSPLQTLTATANVATGESVKWYDAPTGGNLIASPTLNATGTVTYYAEAVNDVTSCVSSSRASVVLTINPLSVAPVSAGDIVECEMSPIQTLTANATVNSGETIKWYDALTGGNVVTSPILNAIGTVTYYAETVNDISLCTSLSRTPVVLTINPIPVVPVSGGDITECEMSPLQTLTANATVENGSTVKWYDALTGGNEVTSPTLNAIGTITYYAEAVKDISLCTSTSRTPVMLTINPRPVAPINNGDQIVCTDGTSTQTLTATATGSSITWYSSAVGGNVVVNPSQVGVGTVTYYAEESNGVCPSFVKTPVILTIVGIVPDPIASDQTVCSNGTSTQTITATATGNTITWYDSLVGGSIVSNPSQVGVGVSTYYAESSIGNCISLSRTKVVLTITAIPLVPTLVSITQPTCLISSGEIIITPQANTEYSIGSGFQQSNVFQNIMPGNYTISVRFLNNISCPVNAITVQTVNPIPSQIQFVVAGECDGKDYVLTSSPLANSYDPNAVEYIWKDENGIQVGTDSNVLNVSDVLNSKSGNAVFPLTYSLTVKSISTGCETSNNVVIESTHCNIQRGISPDGNGSNDFFDLRLMDVKKLEIFNRYGIKVYSQSDYTDQWKGQSNKGEDLPSATYYYVIEFNSGEPKTGWIYLIREKQ